MGQKSKLKQDRRAAKIENNNQEVVSLASVSASASALTKTTTSAIVNDEVDDELDDKFPQLDCYLQAVELSKIEIKKLEMMTIIDKWLLGTTEYGCIHSMYIHIEVNLQFLYQD